MLLSAAAALLLATGRVQPILTPVGYDVAVIRRDDGSEVATLLRVTTSALDTGRLSQEQMAKWNDLKSRIAAQYAGADRRGRAHLLVDLYDLEGPDRRRDDNSVWVRFATGDMTHAERLSHPHDGSVWRITDPTTGQYVAIVTYEDTSKLLRIFREMFADTKRPDVKEKVRAELERLAERSDALVEVNGQRQYVAKGQVKAALAAELSGLLPNLEGDGRSRILDSISILNAFLHGSLKADQRFLGSEVGICSAPCDVKALPLPPVAATLKAHATAHRMPALEPLDEAIAKEFFGDAGRPVPDLDLPFAGQVRKLLSAAD
jgi:hypothetical protein